MLRVTTLYASSATATAQYYTRYLTDADGELPGRWTGRQAGLLGLSGEVTTEQLEALLEGRDPISGTRLGYPLVDRVEKSGRVRKAVAGFDATFSAPKSVSVWWALTGDERLAFVVTGGGTLPADLAAFDAICQDAIDDQIPTRTAVAYVSTSTTSAAERLPAVDRGWIRGDGTVIARTKEEMAEGRWATPIRHRPDGADIGSATTFRTGMATGPGDVGENCNDWAVTDDSTTFRGGHAYQIGPGAMVSRTRDCDYSWGVYCIETTVGTP